VAFVFCFVVNIISIVFGNFTFVQCKYFGSLFRKCCREGLASDFVLKEMADLSTPGLYQSLLEGVTNEYGNLPKSWSANV